MDLDVQGQIKLKIEILPNFELKFVGTITPQLFKLISLTLDWSVVQNNSVKVLTVFGSDSYTASWSQLFRSVHPLHVY